VHLINILSQSPRIGEILGVYSCCTIGDVGIPVDRSGYDRDEIPYEGLLGRKEGG